MPRARTAANREPSPTSRAGTSRARGWTRTLGVAALSICVITGYIIHYSTPTATDQAMAVPDQASIPKASPPRQPVSQPDAAQSFNAAEAGRVLLRQLEAMRLASTLVGRTFKSAVIDGQSRCVGDPIGPFRIAAIHPNHVILNYGNSPYRLDMRR